MLVVVAIFLFASACQVTVRAGIDAHADGTGYVRAAVALDADAARAAPDLAEQLRDDDLRQTGWTVSGPAKEDDGLTWVRASKPFSTPAQATTVMGELTGPAGPFRSFALRQDRSLLKSRTTFTGAVDLTGGLSGFVDSDLQAKLGEPLKLDEKAFRFEVEAHLPGTDRTWTPPLGQQTELRAAAESWRLVPVVPAALALLCVAGAVVLTVRARRSR